MALLPEPPIQLCLRVLMVVPKQILSLFQLPPIPQFQVPPLPRQVEQWQTEQLLQMEPEEQELTPISGAAAKPPKPLQGLP